jgi:GNAT superfamily N-acetyltransferase
MNPDARWPHARLSDPAIVLADDTCTDVLGQVITDAFFDLAACQWLIPDPAARRQVFPGYFRLRIEHALAHGIVLTTSDQAAVALWLPAGEEPAEPPGGYGERLAAVTGRWADRFGIYDPVLGRRHSSGLACHHLALLAVRPDRQGQGLGTALLRAHHAALDRDGIAACLEAASIRSRRLYHAEGYEDRGGLIFQAGAAMFPMVRWPRPGNQAGQAAVGVLTTVAAAAGQRPFPSVAARDRRRPGPGITPRRPCRCGPWHRTSPGTSERGFLPTITPVAGKETRP